MREKLLKSQFDTLEEPSDAILVDVSESQEEIVQKIIRALGI
jgi:gluconokinase